MSERITPRQFHEAAGVDDFRQCDSEPRLAPDRSITLDPAAVDEIASGDCAAPTATDTVASGFDARVLRAGEQCFVVMSASGSGNVFWFIKHDDGSVEHDCRTHNQNGCPANGEWAG